MKTFLLIALLFSSQALPAASAEDQFLERRIFPLDPSLDPDHFFFAHPLALEIDRLITARSAAERSFPFNLPANWVAS